MYPRKIRHVKSRRIIYEFSFKMGVLNEKRCKISNIKKSNGKLLYNGQQGVFGRSTLDTEYFEPRKEEIINASLQRQALKQTLSALPEDIESYTSAFLDGKFLPKKTKKVSKKKGGFKKYKTLSTRHTNKRKNNKNNKTKKNKR
jgi:hypothetical protein